MTLKIWPALFVLTIALTELSAQGLRTVLQTTANGVLEGVVSADGKVRTFKGVPYAAPPVGPLRWKAPQPAPVWTGVRQAVEYGMRPMQGRIFDDMVFHDEGPSEDCLYLNLWLPEIRPLGRLPVMVWIYGGGFVSGSTSESRQDGGNLCTKGVLVVSMNYRLGAFGFLALPELRKESGHDASGNYGLMDQIAALEWVKRNIADFGGDPDNVTVFGQSAGSTSVCALMASPQARFLFHHAIGESGSIVKSGPPLMHGAEAEEWGVKFVESAFGTSSIDALRGKPASEILAASLKVPRKFFSPIVDGYILTANGDSIYQSGQQVHIPLLAGWNRDEDTFHAFLGSDEPNLANYMTHARARFGPNADAFLKVYPATTDAEAKRAAQDLGGDEATGFSSWRWMELHRMTGSSRVYRYLFEQTLPLPANAAPDAEASAPHSADIEFVFRVLSSRKLSWRQEDRALSELMATYWTNFAKAGDPNGPGLPLWPVYEEQFGYPVMHLKAGAESRPDTLRARYEFLDRQRLVEKDRKYPLPALAQRGATPHPE